MTGTSSVKKEEDASLSGTIDGASKKLSLALIIGLLVCCLLPVVIISAGVGITSYYILHKSDILIFSAFILILLTIGAIMWIFKRRRYGAREAEIDIEGQQRTERTARAKLAKDHCCDGESKSN